MIGERGNQDGGEERGEDGGEDFCLASAFFLIPSLRNESLILDKQLSFLPPTYIPRAGLYSFVAVL